MPSVLVIDDEQSIRYSLEVGLQTDELRIHAASTGRQGLALIPEIKPDAVILDIRLPDLTGLEVFDRIRAIDLLDRPDRDIWSLSGPL